MAEFLVKAVSATNPDPEKDRRGSHKKGDIIVVMDDDHTWGAGEGLPTFVIVKCPTVSVATVQDRLDPWVWSIDFEVLSSDLALDTHRIKMTNTTKSVSGAAVPTPSRVMMFLEQWNATPFESDADSVTFDMSVFDTATSEAFWRNLGTADLQFTETGYVQEGGVHTIAMEYSSHPAYIERPTDFTTMIENEIAAAGGTVLSTVPATTTFTVTRNAVRDRFRDFVTQSLGTWQRHRYHFTEAQVDTVIAAGGTITVTAGQLAAAVQDRTQA